MLIMNALHILCFGNSITAGWTRPPYPHPYTFKLVEILEKALPSTNVTVDIQGLPGDQVVTPPGGYVTRMDILCKVLYNLFLPSSVQCFYNHFLSTFHEPNLHMIPKPLRHQSIAPHITPLFLQSNTPRWRGRDYLRLGYHPRRHQWLRSKPWCKHHLGIPPKDLCFPSQQRH